jgi:hypothetical protein
MTLQKETNNMTIKQLIRRLNANARRFADQGDLNKSMAAAEAAAVLKRDFSDVKGKMEI